MSFVKHSIIVFLLVNVVRESVCDVEVYYSVTSNGEGQQELVWNDIDLPTTVTLRDADGNINIGTENNIVGKANTVQGNGNSVTGDNNVVNGNKNVISANMDDGEKNRATRQTSHQNNVIGNFNSVTGTGDTVKGNYNTVPGNNNWVIGNYNVISGRNNRIIGNNNRCHVSGIVFTGNNLDI